MGTTMSMNAAKTMIVGAGGCVGVATLESLLLNGNGQVDVHCGVRNLSKFKTHMIDVPTVPMDMENINQMTQALMGFDRVFIVVPSSKDRTKLAINALEAAKAANVKYILLLSVTIASSDTIFGRQFKPIEEKVRSMDVPYTIIRLPMFLDNVFMHGISVAEDSLIYDPRDPREAFSYVTLSDVGKCAAQILVDPSRHMNKTYKLIGGTYSTIELSETLSKVLSKKIKVKETSWNQFHEANRQGDVPKWQVDGTIEWLKFDPNVWITEEDQNAIKTITGDNPITLKYFVSQHAAKFGWRRPLIYGGDKDIRDDPIMQSRLVYAS
jgi:uncharacterized protein YbjT (DUF2867 family)